ncbi:uncharacterized protein LOC116348524 [Contarinia nasturtii]|uniref:uncharacterized protein LOC116348121 n=1 Tax=Contarinia nasturtii TaxID=265458 RepID=UPI0012D39B6E|nr:uncharacterized protein LOC116348121 [Contarinia nasturtii]XP_031634852.1 uncharacterized protein LOC116348122 [Contarinia nasturtii]XP_031635414.1 uncharacterized protein LOC116348524 [Contarinia nasturtii]
MANNILSIKNSIVDENDVISQQFHTYTPYTTSFNNNDEVRITIQSQDLITLPSQSYIYMEFSCARTDNELFANNQAVFSYNFTSHMFSEMRYELNGIEIDRNKLPGITSIMKCVVACKSEDHYLYELFNDKGDKSITTGTYRMMIPLRFIFGFCDDFRKVILNCKHELILVRNRSNICVYQSNADILTLTINKIQWKVPHVSLSDQAKLSMLKTISRNENLYIPYRSWDLYELPALPTTNRHTWSVKTTSQVRKPRYVIVAFQTNRSTIVNDSSAFDTCNISNVKLYLNNERYPYDDLNLQFTADHFSELFHMVKTIQCTYYNEVSFYNPTEYNLDNFTKKPMFAFDCTKSDESVKTGMVDVRLELEARENFPALTTAYCLIIHDNLVRYSPFSSIVHREI